MLANESCLSHLQQNRAGCVSYLLLMSKWEVEQVRSETESDRRQVRKRQAEKGREGKLVSTPQIFQCWSWHPHSGKSWIFVRQQAFLTPGDCNDHFQVKVTPVSWTDEPISIYSEPNIPTKKKKIKVWDCLFKGNWMWKTKREIHPMHHFKPGLFLKRKQNRFAQGMQPSISKFLCVPCWHFQCSREQHCWAG